MKSCCCWTVRALALAIAAIISLSTLPKLSLAQDQTTSFRLSPGVVVDRNHNEAYVMSPAGGIVAIDLVQGRELWHSHDAAKPLGLAGDLLVSQAEPSAGANALKIVTLNTREGGRSVIESSVDLPPGVRVSLGKTSTDGFTAEVLTDTDSAVVSWEFVGHPLRAMPPRAPEVLPGEVRRDTGRASKERAAADRASETTRRAFRLDLSSGKTTSELVEAVQALRAARVNQSLDPRLPDVPEPQFLSTDGGHILSSQRIADDSVLETYLWSIYDRNTRDRVGQFRAHVSFAPFFVSDGKIIYETGPYATRTQSGIMEEPLQIRAVDLRTGETAWSQSVRDINRRASLPP